jgi:glycosyltransferase involved in cell wall biosynthesis
MPAAETDAQQSVCVVVQGWPRISTTFVAQELVGLEQEGVPLWLATFGKSDYVRHSIHEQLRAPIHRLPSGLSHPLRVAAAWRKVRQLPGFRAAVAAFRAEVAEKRTAKAVNDFGRGMMLAAALPADVGMIYAHFIQSATSIARYAALIRGLPLAASAHAKDIWTTSERDKQVKLAQMDWLTTCTGPGAEYLAKLAGDPAKVHLIRHGLSFERFPADPPQREARDGSDEPVQLLTVGRAVEKKGFDLLLDALAALPQDLAWRLHHVGYGKLIGSLQEQARTLGIADRIVWHGAQDQAAVIDLYRASDLFVLPSREGGDGDRDGLPNVLMEAQSQALACLSTRFSAIPELIVDAETGLLVPPGELEPLRNALETLIRNPVERERLGIAGYQRVRSEFRAETGIAEIARLLRGTIAKTPRK